MKKHEIYSYFLFLLCVPIFCSTKATSSNLKIKNFTPNYLPKLKATPLGPTLLSNISSFLDAPTKDQSKLEQILQSGNMDGFFDYIQVFGVFEHLLVNYPYYVMGVESIGDSYQKLPMMAIRVGIRNKKNKKILNSIYSDSHYYERSNASESQQTMELLMNPQKHKQTKRGVIMFTGAHHSRELLTQNMILKIVLEAMYHIMHFEPTETSFWHFSDVLAVPFINIDGHAFIYNSYQITQNPDFTASNEWLDKGKVIPSYEIGKWKRKNMNSEYCPSSESGVEVGVDLNRNYGYQWGHSEDEDEQPCSEVYKGPFPFSEPETQNIKKLVTRERNHLSLVLNFHTYGNLWVQPYNYSKHKNLEYFKLDRHIINFYKQMRKEILRISPHSKVGNAIEMVDYVARGEASDWLMGEHKIVSYSPELGYSDKQFDDFFINRDLINKALNENFQVISAMMEKTRFSVDDFDYYLDSKGNFVIEFENYSLGKIFEGILRLQTSDNKLFSKIKSIRVSQENEQTGVPSFSVFQENGEQLYQSKIQQIGKKHSIPQGGQTLEIYLPVMRNLSKFQVHFEMDANVSDLYIIPLNFDIVFDQIFTMSSHEIKLKFNTPIKVSVTACLLIANILIVFVYLVTQMIKKKLMRKKEKQKQEAADRPVEIKA